MSPTPLAVTNLSSVILRSAAYSHTPAWMADFLYQKLLKTSSYYNTYSGHDRAVMARGGHVGGIWTIALVPRTIGTRPLVPLSWTIGTTVMDDWYHCHGRLAHGLFIGTMHLPCTMYHILRVTILNSILVT